MLVLLWHGVFQLQRNSGIWSRLLSLGSLAWSGVDLFFVLSGFLIGGILLDEKESPRYFKTFYIRRAYRILPLYGLLLAIQICTRAQFLPRWLAQASSDPIPLWSYLSFTQNMYMAAIAGFGSLVMTATWSLAIEEQFYLTAPLLVRRLRRPAFVIVLLAIVVLAPVLRSALYVGMRQGGFASYVVMPCRADDLCLGILVSLVMRNGKLWRPSCALIPAYTGSPLPWQHRCSISHSNAMAPTALSWSPGAILCWDSSTPAVCSSRLRLADALKRSFATDCSSNSGRSHTALTWSTFL